MRYYLKFTILTALVLFIVAALFGLAKKAEAANVSTIFSVSAWVRPVSSVVSKALVIKNQEIRLITDDSSKFACQIHNGTAWQTGATSTDALSLNAWQHITCTYDRSNIKVYVNGVEKGSQAMSNVDIQDTANAWNYGKDEGGDYGYFAGRMDDIRIYNYALTSKQIAQVMNAGHPAVGSPVGSYVGYWKFDEMQGTTAYDQSIHQNNLTLSSASWTTTTDCKFAGCYQGADNKRITRADDADFDFGAADDFSVSVWFKRNTISNAEYLLHKQAGFEGYAIYLDASGDVVFGIGDTNSTAFPEESIGNIARNYDDNTWHLATAVKTSNTRIDLYVDGVLIASDTSLTTDADLTNSGKLIIGDQDEADGTDEFLGNIDEIAFYRFALSPAEIKQLYNKSASLKLGSLSTASDGSTPSDSKSREYCIPGDTAACSPPVLHIKMDEKTGDTAFDTSGNGNNGDLAGTCPGGATCPVWKSAASCHEGACLSFDGNDDYVNISDSSSLRLTGDFSIAFWLNQDTAPADFDSLISKSSDADTRYNYRILTESDRQVHSQIMKSGVNIVDITTSGTITLDEWVHIVFLFRANTSNGGEIYFNGVKQAVTGTNIADTPVGGNYSLFFGKTIYNASDYYFFDGLIDDVRIYNYARTPAQIAWDYNRGAPIAHWKMDEGQDTATTCDSTGSVVYDSGYSCLNGGTCRNGTLSLTPAGNTTPATAWSEGKYNCALDFDGTDDYIYAADNAIFSFGNSTAGTDIPFSISSWAKMDDATNFRIVSKRQSAAAREYTFFSNASDKLELYLWDNSASAYLGRSYNTALTSLEGQWAHLTATYDGTASASGIKLYLNGIRVDDTNDNSGTYVAMENLAAQLEIGRSVEASTYYSNGQIDDVRMYNYALTAEQIKMLYNEGTAVRFGPTEGLP